MIEIALKSSRDYCEKWWRLLRKVVEIASNNGRGDAKKRLSWLQKGARVGEEVPEIACERWHCQALCPQSLGIVLKSV